MLVANSNRTSCSPQTHMYPQRLVCVHLVAGCRCTGIYTGESSPLAYRSGGLVPLPGILSTCCACTNKGHPQSAEPGRNRCPSGCVQGKHARLELQPGSMIIILTILHTSDVCQLQPSHSSSIHITVVKRSIPLIDMISSLKCFGNIRQISFML
jgi:hypothetical protein